MKKYFIPNLCILSIDKHDFILYNKGTKLRNEVLKMNKPIYQGEVVRMINDKTGVIVEHDFDDPIDADFFENHLELMDVHFQRWSKGEMLYEENEIKA